MEKLLVICGPTATGKTKLALHLAKVFNGELVSADSRQVYKGMDIGTGKDLPVNSKFQMTNDKLGFGNLDLGFYTVSGVRIWGYDLVEPKEEFSVAQYIKIAERILKNIWERSKLPILVGGTGLYIKGIIDGIDTLGVPKNITLRKLLEEKNPGALFEILAQIDALKAASMNASDRKNPRRLVRAIEIAHYKSQIPNPKSQKILNVDVLFIGLTASREILQKNIEKRVEERLKRGLEQEIINLLASGVTWENQAMNSLGYKEWKGYFKKFGEKCGWKKGNTETLKEFESTVRIRVIEEWKQGEKQYVKRQLTWFKKDKRITWFEISKPGWEVRVEKLVRKWYKS